MKEKHICASSVKEMQKKNNSAMTSHESKVSISNLVRVPWEETIDEGSCYSSRHHLLKELALRRCILAVQCAWPRGMCSAGRRKARTRDKEKVRQLICTQSVSWRKRDGRGGEGMLLCIPAAVRGTNLFVLSETGSGQSLTAGLQGKTINTDSYSIVIDTDS